MWALWTWLFSFFFILALLLLLGFQLICLVDLEYDYINPYDSASRINRVVLPEFITQGVLCLILLATGHWLVCLLHLPYLYYNVRQYIQGQHLVDVTEIYSQLKVEKKKRFIKMGYLIFLFIFSLFWLLFTLGEEYD
ncbi:protein cornichon homolog 4-like [Humulus lupulus]|uniref:protein cornichon homolog 4-like n=1 Tax=Humulus lupulus TaxID=3486 RepID=UPI002B418191|nr:protein cornichon homolog 4-like [Humulus lupulus]XP_062090508.1 protein cornichon homolog 4-like [Humulus lupulus]XP_062090509.1 protein cornichon homolog 4-like [Humulus lupulus]